MQVLKKETKNICNVCYEEIPARVVSEDGCVFLEKTCPVHGYFKAVVEKDINFYKRFYHQRPFGSPSFDCLLIPITFRCNMDCKFCYTYNCKREDYSLKYLEKIINNFSGDEIVLSGGEPTVREDLVDIIKIVKEAKKFCVLVTNGLKLVDRAYLCKLKEAGLDRVFFSLDSLKPLNYEKFKLDIGEGQRILDLKLRALRNLEKERINTYLSTTLYPGVNDREMKELLTFCLKNNHFIFNFSIRSYVKVGRFMETSSLFLSELLDKFSRILLVDKNKLLSKCLKKGVYHSIHRIPLSIRGILVGARFYPFVSNENSRFDKINKLIFILKVLLQIRINEAIRIINNLLTQKNRFKYLNVKLISWSTKENIDLEEHMRGSAHLYDNDKIGGLCYGIVMLDKPFKNEQRPAEIVNI